MIPYGKNKQADPLYTKDKIHKNIVLICWSLQTMGKVRNTLILILKIKKARNQIDNITKHRSPIRQTVFDPHF